MHRKEPWMTKSLNMWEGYWGVWADHKDEQTGEEIQIEVCRVMGETADIRIEDFAHRIVACVNGCEGINPEAVKDLLEACKEAEKWTEIASKDVTSIGALAALATLNGKLRKAIAKSENQ